jgi:hypothetical protein
MRIYLIIVNEIEKSQLGKGKTVKKTFLIRDRDRPVRISSP